MRAAPATIGGMPRSSKARQRAAVAHQFALALQHVHRQRGLAVLEGGELLRARARNRRIARDDLLDQAAHRLDAQRQRDHVQQQPVVARGAVAGQQIGLDRGAERDHLVGVDVGVRDGLEEFATARRTCGMRVAPPTITTPSTSSTGTLASRMAFLMR
jgi:hypothetical protein